MQRPDMLPMNGPIPLERYATPVPMQMPRTEVLPVSAPTPTPRPITDADVSLVDSYFAEQAPVATPASPDSYDVQALEIWDEALRSEAARQIAEARVPIRYDFGQVENKYYPWNWKRVLRSTILAPFVSGGAGAIEAAGENVLDVWRAVQPRTTHEDALRAIMARARQDYRGDAAAAVRQAMREVPLVEVWDDGKTATWWPYDTTVVPLANAERGDYNSEHWSAEKVREWLRDTFGYTGPASYTSRWVSDDPANPLSGGRYERTPYRARRSN
jgi:hypothetical protein